MVWLIFFLLPDLNDGLHTHTHTHTSIFVPNHCKLCFSPNAKVCKCFKTNLASVVNWWQLKSHYTKCWIYYPIKRLNHHSGSPHSVNIQIKVCQATMNNVWRRKKLLLSVALPEYCIDGAILNIVNSLTWSIAHLISQHPRMHFHAENCVFKGISTSGHFSVTNRSWHAIYSDRNALL